MDNTDPVTITLTAVTSAGYNDGESTCYYSLDGQSKNFVEFYNTGTAITLKI
jgi:hypothetical protein